MDMKLVDLITDLKRIWKHEGYCECKYEDYLHDDMAAVHEFDALIPLANKYQIEWKDLYGAEDVKEIWDNENILSWRIEKKVIENIKTINNEIGDYCEC